MLGVTSHPTSSREGRRCHATTQIASFKVSKECVYVCVCVSVFMVVGNSLGGWMDGGSMCLFSSSPSFEDSRFRQQPDAVSQRHDTSLVWHGSFLVFSS